MTAPTNAPQGVDVRSSTYRVSYFRKSDNAEFVREFSTHAAAKQFASRKQHEPGWVAAWPVKVSRIGSAK